MYKKEVFLEIDTNLHSPIQSMEADSNSRLIRFNLTNNYMPFRLTGKKVIFKAVKPDGTDIVNDCIIIDEENGIIEVEITKQINAISGRVNCQLSIIGADDYVLKTKKFIISVDSKLNQSGVVSSKEYKTLENALAKVQSIDENFDKVNTAILELATKGTTVEVIERATKQEIDRQIADGTIAHLTIQDGSVTPEKTSFYGEVASHEKVLKNAQTDYMGNARGTVKEAMDSNVDWLLGEINTVHYDGQHITATDSIEGQCKSAILKGNTLVNLVPKAKVSLASGDISRFSNVNSELNYLTATVNSSLQGIWHYVKSPINLSLLKPNTKYLVKFDQIQGIDSISVMRGGGTEPLTNNRVINSNHVILTTNSLIEINEQVLFLAISPSTPAGTKIIVSNPMIIEYQEDMENWDIPYFEGMQSVKMPVLTTTGKNIVNEKIWEIETEEEEYQCLLFDGFVTTDLKSGNPIIIPVNVKKGKKYTLKCKNKATSYFNYFYLIDDLIDGKVKTNRTRIAENNTLNSFVDTIATFTADGDYKYLHIDTGSPVAKGYIVKNTLQLEESSSATTYEPYKSNILSTSEDVVLRGIGDVQDTLDCLTGEVIERIGEIVLDGSEEWVMSDYTRPNHLRLYFTGSKFKQYQNVINSRFPNIGNIKGRDVEGVYITNTFDIQVEHSRLSEVSVVGFKQWLSQNPITVQYQLKTESIKTVDLSDNHVYSYKGTTHYDCSSAEGSLVPTLSIDVPTNLPAVVTRQRVTIQELEKENVALKNEIEETANSSVNGDLELMSSQFELDFRLFEIEMNLDMPMMAMMRGVKSMAMTVYQQAKTLILAGKYEREDMEYKLNRYKAAGRIAVEEYEELIALMDARELVD